MDRNRSRVRTGSSRGSRSDSEALWDWNLESDRIRFSPRWMALAGCEDHEVGSAPADWFQRVHPDDREQLIREIESARAGDATTFVCQYRLRHTDGSYRWLSCQGTVVRDNRGRAIRLTSADSDVTVAMVTDPLTRLPNRLLLIDRVTHSIERARRYKAFHFALLIIDLDTPTSLGHSSAITDTVLTAVARRLETCLRVPETMPTLRNNDLVARLEGHRFAILLDGLKDIGHAKIAADRILSELLNPLTIGGREVRLSASIGIALSATGYTRADAVVHDAETALHRARVLGGSHCEVFDTAILQSEQTELQLEGDFEGALQRREFELFYQPIVSLTSNEVLGFESLVRWRHPVLGLVSPLDFIPIAERTGFIVPLGAWILHDACARLAAWRTSLPLREDLWVSVNVSSVQWSDPTLIDHIQTALHDSGLEPRHLVLELTEGIAIANRASMITLLMQLRAIGVRISVDDFGTGYSSLAYLRQFPIDTLKIDRSFVRGMVSNKDTAEIVAGIMNLSKQLGLSVVAEGVEREDQWVQLRELNCQAGQGNLFATPLDFESATEVLKSGLGTPPTSEQQTTPPRRRETVDIRELLVRARHLVTGHALSFAVAVLALSLAGVYAVVSGGRPDVTAAVMPAAPVKQQSVEMPPAAPVAAKAAPSISGVATQHESSARDAAQSPPQPPVVRTVSLKVVHLHRFGDCRGRLQVNRDGIAFVPEENDADAFVFGFAEFLHAVTDDTLTLRSANKTYRFKAAGGAGDNTSTLREFADRMSRARR